MDTINVNSCDIFTPIEGGNDKLDNPVRFHIQFLTIEDQSEMEYFEWVPGDKGGRAKIKINSPFLFRKSVVKVEGLPGVETADQYLSMRASSKYTAMMREEAEYIRKSMEIDSKN